MDNKRLLLYAICFVGLSIAVVKMKKQKRLAPAVSEPTKVKQHETEPKPAIGRGVHHAGDYDFDRYLNAGKPVIVDFYATWCGPCKMMSPLVTRLEKEMGDKIIVVKVDVDQAKSIAQRYNVKAMPTFIFINSHGKEVETKVGGMQYEELQRRAQGLQ